MSGICGVYMNNGSGVQIDKLIMWHVPKDSPGGPSLEDLNFDRAFMKVTNLADGQTEHAQVPLSHSALDDWVCAMQFNGDSTTYIMCGDAFNPYKEFEVSSETSLHFSVGPYKGFDQSQSEMSLLYENGSSREKASAHLLTETAVTVINVAEQIAGGLAKLVPE